MSEKQLKKELKQACAWIQILLNIGDSPPGEHAHIRAEAECFATKEIK